MSEKIRKPISEKGKKWIIGLSIFALIVVAIGVTYAIDYAESTKYSFELIKISDTTVVADGKSTIKGRVCLKKKGNVVEGHTIYIYTSNGSIPTSRLVTDSKGIVTFTYYSFLYINDKISPLNKVDITFQDESNSKVFLVPATWTITMPSTKPEGYQITTDWQGYEINQ
jgi:hypothetical protein